MGELNNKIFVKNTQVLAREIEGEIIIVLEDLDMYQLSDSVSLYIWSLINGKNKVSRIKEKLQERFYGVSEEQVESDLREFLSALEKKKIIKYA